MPQLRILMLQVCTLTVLAKIKFSQKFPNLQYCVTNGVRGFYVGLSLHLDFSGTYVKL